MPRYRFGPFTLSPRRRALLREGRDEPLIPRYFDLLVFLVERRGEAIHRRDIFDRVWSDVVVSDSALSQAIRTIRRVLDDDSRDPRFVRTVSRHGYEFVFPHVVEEDDAADLPAAAVAPTTSAPEDPFVALLHQLTKDDLDEEGRREAAERLHALGTAEALRRLNTSPPSAMARALLRDTRWDSPHAGPVPILGAPDAIAVAWHVVRPRLRRLAGLAAARWADALLGGGLAGAVAGGLGGLLLATIPAATAPITAVPVLAAIGAVCGAAGAAGVGAGLSVAESVLRSRRTLGLIAGGAMGGATIGTAIELLGRWSVALLAGRALAVGGGIEGLVLGAAAGFGYALATRRSSGGLAAPRGAARVRTVLSVAATCGLAGLALALTGRQLVGGTLHLLAQGAGGGQTLLSPLGSLIGEPGFGPATASLISLGESATFGLGLAVGLTRRH